MRKIVLPSLIFLAFAVLGYVVTPRQTIATVPATQDMAAMFANHQFSDDFWAWELDRRLALIDNLVRDPYLSQARLQWGKEGMSQAEMLHVARYIRDMQVDAYRDMALMPNLQPPYLGFATLWVIQARGVYQQTQQMVLINEAVDWDQLHFDDLASVVLHETAHHIYAYLGHQIAHNHIHVSQDMMDDGVILWLNTPKGGHVYFGDAYGLNPQERLAWDAQEMADFIGLDIRRATSLNSLSQRFAALEALKQRWLKTL